MHGCGEGEIWFGKQMVAFNFVPILTKEYLINIEMIGGHSYQDVIFLSAKRQGYENVSQHFVPLVKSWAPIVKMGLEWLDLFGLGRFRTVKADNKDGFVVLAGRATFGMEMKSERPDIDPLILLWRAW